MLSKYKFYPKLPISEAPMQLSSIASFFLFPPNSLVAATILLYNGSSLVTGDRLADIGLENIKATTMSYWTLICVFFILVLPDANLFPVGIHQHSSFFSAAHAMLLLEVEKYQETNQIHLVCSNENLPNLGHEFKSLNHSSL